MRVTHKRGRAGQGGTTSSRKRGKSVIQRRRSRVGGSRHLAYLWHRVAIQYHQKVPNKFYTSSRLFGYAFACASLLSRVAGAITHRTASRNLFRAPLRGSANKKLKTLWGLCANVVTCKQGAGSRCCCSARCQTFREPEGFGPIWYITRGTSSFHARHKKGNAADTRRNKMPGRQSILLLAKVCLCSGNAVGSASERAKVFHFS